MREGIKVRERENGHWVGRGTNWSESDGSAHHLPLLIHKEAQKGLRLLLNIAQRSTEPKPNAPFPGPIPVDGRQ